MKKGDIGYEVRTDIPLGRRISRKLIVIRETKCYFIATLNEPNSQDRRWFRKSDGVGTPKGPYPRKFELIGEK